MKAKLKNVFNLTTVSYWRPLILFVFIILFDQLSKYLVIRYRLFPIFVNYNVAFSLPIPWFLPWLLFFLSACYFFFSSDRSKYYSQFVKFISLPSFSSLAVIMIAAGGVSNLIDRVFYNGGVIDFIDLRWWPVFNLADSFIVCGVVVFLFSSFKQSSDMKL